MAQKMPAARPNSAQSPMAHNNAIRANFIKNSYTMYKTLSSVPIVAGTAAYAIPLNNQGALVALDVEFVINITAGAAALTPNPGAPYNFVSNYNFVDQSNVQRHNVSGQGLWDYLSRKTDNGYPFGASEAFASGGGSYPVNTLDFSVPTPAAAGTGVVRFWQRVPISRSMVDTRGMVLLQTGNQNQPAVLNITLTSQIAGQGNSPYNNAFTITGGSIIVHQIYYQPKTGVLAPPLDTKMQWALSETGQDNTNLIAGALKQVQFQTQYLTYAVGIRYYNGNGYTYGTDMTSVIEKGTGGTLYINDDSPNLRFRRYRANHGTECAPGLYWFNYDTNPLQYKEVGVYEADFVPATVNAGAYITQLYDWLKVPDQLLTNAGAYQV
jgi:hypothetical protein